MLCAQLTSRQLTRPTFRLTNAPSEIFRVTRNYQSTHFVCNSIDCEKGDTVLRAFDLVRLRLAIVLLIRSEGEVEIVLSYIILPLICVNTSLFSSFRS